MTAWKVFRFNSKHQKLHVDTVYFTFDCEADYVRRELINHGDYPGDIWVVKEENVNNAPTVIDLTKAMVDDLSFTLVTTDPETRDPARPVRQLTTAAFQNDPVVIGGVLFQVVSLRMEVRQSNRLAGPDLNFTHFDLRAFTAVPN